MSAETRLFLALAILLIVGRALGEVARRLGQPSVVGELFAGILLGPAVLGRLWPEGLEMLFPRTGPSATLCQTTLDGGMVRRGWMSRRLMISVQTRSAPVAPVSPVSELSSLPSQMPITQWRLGS